MITSVSRSVLKRGASGIVAAALSIRLQLMYRVTVHLNPINTPALPFPEAMYASQAPEHYL